jgi:hypothetical protein
MHYRKLEAAVAAGLLAGSLAAPASAQESVLDRPVDKEGWPTEITRRPLTLARDMLEVMVPLDVTLSLRRAGEPVFLAPSVYYGVTDALTLGIRHFLGLCLSGSDHGCPKTYNDVSLDAIWRVRHESGSDLAMAASLNASPISDPFTLSGDSAAPSRWRWRRPSTSGSTSATRPSSRPRRWPSRSLPFPSAGWNSRRGTGNS